MRDWPCQVVDHELEDWLYFFLAVTGVMSQSCVLNCVSNCIKVADVDIPIRLSPGYYAPGTSMQQQCGLEDSP
jgi:hypothetical protein